MLDRSNPRSPVVEIDSMFIDRWSPRAFDASPLSDEQVTSLFEAARWSPSCYNDQPWLFIYAHSEDDRKRFLPILVEANQVWARNAPLLIFLLCRKTFARNGKPNRHAPYDAGAAWMALALQARKLGLHAHAMAGFNIKQAYDVLQVPEDEYDVMAAIAVGRRTSPDILPDAAAANEKPNERKPLGEIIREGGF